MDGRRETVYRCRSLNTQIGVHEGTADGLAELARARPDYVWLPITSERTREWLRTHGYREDVRSPRSFVAARAEFPLLRHGTASPDVFRGRSNGIFIPLTSWLSTLPARRWLPSPEVTRQRLPQLA